MKLNKVKSSVIDSIGYEPSANILGVVFLTKKQLWLYLGVPDKIFETFAIAESKGTFFNKEIKNIYSCFAIEDREVMPVGVFDLFNNIADMFAEM